MNQNDIKKESVPGIKPKYIEVYKFYDGNTDKWALGDSRNHLTTFFDNDMNLMPINDHTVMFIGEVEGDIDLYICDGQGFSKNTANMSVPCEGTIKDLKNHGFWVVGTAMEGNYDFKEIDYSGKIALVIGNEGNGMSKGVTDVCDYIAKIPMKGKINSLNASVAAGIMIYEMIRLD